MTVEVTAGFMPLLDSAILIVAHEKDFAEAEGIRLSLKRETSWASIRDRMAVGQFDAAHLLGPMPIACNLGMTPLAAPTIVPMALGLGGNAVVVSNSLWDAMADEGARADLEPAAAGRAMKAILANRRVRGLAPPRFGVVHPHSGHNYELRYWLAACGVEPERDVEIVILPPPLMAEAVAAGCIDGYCAGEPWNTAAVAKGGVGHIVTVKAAIWKSSPEKVLGVSERWAHANPDALEALLRALYRAAEWCAQPDNHAELARLLASPRYVDCPADWLTPALSGDIETGAGVVHIADFFVPHAKAATFPWKSHALWFYSQMVRWGQIAASAAHAETARATYRPDLYRAALKPLGVALPAANAKVEGALLSSTPVGSSGASLALGPDGFFDGKVFDPEALDGYLAGLKSAD
jgi:NitT/TauT family transport system ATP-binding protein